MAFAASDHFRAVGFFRCAVAALALLCFCAGCVGTDTRGLRVIGPPIDPSAPVDDEDLKALVTTRELQIREGTDYYLGPGDVVTITLVNQPGLVEDKDQEIGIDYTITDSPLLSLPLIGAIRVQGKTASELQDELRVAYAQFIRDANPIVIVKTYYRNQVSVLGSVQKPGRYPIEFGDTLVEAIFKAGGLSMGGRSGGLAPGKYMKLYREKLSAKERSELTLEELVDRVRTGDQVVPRKEFTIPISDFLFHGVLQYNLPLAPNDIIFVPPAGTAMVQGPVNSPGATFLGPSVQTVSQVIVERGGLRYAADSGIEVVRTTSDGQIISYFMDVRDILTRHTSDFALVDGDQVILYKHPVRHFLEFLGSFFQGSVRAGAAYTYNPAAGV